jgi:hypothetical protein
LRGRLLYRKRGKVEPAYSSGPSEKSAAHHDIHHRIPLSSRLVFSCGGNGIESMDLTGTIEETIRG